MKKFTKTVTLVIILALMFTLPLSGCGKKTPVPSPTPVEQTTQPAISPTPSGAATGTPSDPNSNTASPSPDDNLANNPGADLANNEASIAPLKGTWVSTTAGSSFVVDSSNLVSLVYVNISTSESYSYTGSARVEGEKIIIGDLLTKSDIAFEYKLEGDKLTLTRDSTILEFKKV